MRPRVYFVLQIVFIVLLSIAILLLSVFVLSFIFFSLHESGEQFLLGFGVRGMLTFVTLFPWAALLATLALLSLLEWLLRYFKFGYRLPILRIFIGISAITFIASVLVTVTPLHSSLLGRAEQNELPIIGEFYEAVHDSHESQGIFRGEIMSIRGNTFIISYNNNNLDTDDGTWTVIPPTGFNLSAIHVGEIVYVAGTLMQGSIHAYGIQEFVH